MPAARTARAAQTPARIAAGTAVAATLLAATAPAAHATGESPGPKMHATPGNVQPGQTVQLVLTCPTEAAAAANGNSPAGAVRFGPAAAGVFTGTLVVHATTPAGQYPVNAGCSAGPSARKPITTTTTIVVAGRTVTSSVRTGLGGAAGGPDTTQITIGALLATAALGTGIALLRRRHTPTRG